VGGAPAEGWRGSGATFVVASGRAATTPLGACGASGMRLPCGIGSIGSAS
jgi:hypothetical protein